MVAMKTATKKAKLYEQHLLDEAVVPVTPEERGDRGARRESFNRCLSAASAASALIVVARPVVNRWIQATSCTVDCRGSAAEGLPHVSAR